MDDVNLLAKRVVSHLDGQRVPPFDAAEIHARVNTQSTGPKRGMRRRGLVLGLLVLAPTLALAYSNREVFEAAITARLNAEGYKGSVHFSGGESKQMSLVQLREVAPFHVVLAKGLPGDFKLKSISGRGDGTFSLVYYGRRYGIMVNLSAFDPHRFVSGDMVMFKSDRSGARIAKEIRVKMRSMVVGNEQMLIFSNHLSDAQVERIKRETGAHDAPKPPRNATFIGN